MCACGVCVWCVRVVCACGVCEGSRASADLVGSEALEAREAKCKPRSKSE